MASIVNTGRVILISESERDAIVRFARTLNIGVGDDVFIYTQASLGGHSHKAIRRGDKLVPGRYHHDGWVVRNEGGGVLAIGKIHSDDYEQGVVQPSWARYSAPQKEQVNYSGILGESFRRAMRYWFKR